MSQLGDGQSQRQLRVGELVRKALSDILAQGRIHDPVLETMLVTIPEVRMSPDLKIATAYVLPLGGTPADGDKIVKALAQNKKFLRGQIAPRLTLKYMPDLRFRYDDRFEESSRIDALLNSPEVVRDLHRDEDED
ncbi:30S ribosome-binding factor RbfA [Coralliovum pocilloporae]|uniref:30S ribosome-binding factor RbfA n=1 Tax=Coralliovum pocilloporae TaxID=3066369 RepID=UPI003306E310